MHEVLGDAGRAFLKVFLSALLVVAIGISQQPDLNGAVALGIAGLMAAIGSGIAAIQVFIPKLSFRAHVPEPYGSALDSFLHAFLGVFLVAMTGWLNEANLATWKAAVVSAITGAITAGLRAVQGTLTQGDKPAPQTGFKVTGTAKAGAKTAAVKLAPA